MTKKDRKRTLGEYSAEELAEFGLRKLEDWELDGTEIDISDTPIAINITSNPTIKGITVRELTATLEFFETPELKVEISTDAGVSHTPISMVRTDYDDNTIGLIYYGFDYSEDEFIPEYINRGKMVSGLIEEINCDKEPNWLVKVCNQSNDNYENHYQLINRVIKKEDVIVLTYDETLEK